MWPPSSGSNGSRLKAPTKMFSEAMSSSTKLTLYCQPALEATSVPVASAAPTTLLTWPAAVLERSLANSLGSALGSAATAWAEPTITWPKVVPEYSMAPSGLATWNNTAGATPRYEPLRPLTLASLVCRFTSFPSRRTVMVTGVPGGRGRIRSVSWVKLLTGWPSKAVTVSPIRSPASLAGEAGSDGVQVPLSYALTLAGTQALIVPSWVTLSFAMP